ncbi:MAG: PAS domain S-box protein [Proteobacteria bacterium]|nr:PAS domain S-box protein [Pseudomonadota bacterium]MBU4356153.1 PAS domain S-box protein [Pseudomonadota bacterium]
MHIDLIAPLIIQRDHKQEILGALVFIIDPEKFLFPLIQSWPTASPTAETLLVRQEGDRVLFLNTLRHRKDPPLTITLSLDSPQLPAVFAIKGDAGIVDGLDYRGVPVLAVTKSIPGTSWHMVAKVDKDEVFAGLHREGKMIAAGVFTLVLLVGMSMGWALTAQRKGHYKVLFRLQNERQALLAHFEYLVKYANDIILLVDENLKIIEVNDRACEAYGYTREEMLHLHASDLRDPGTLAEMPEILQRLEQGEGLVYETAHRRQDGTVFLVEVSNRIIAESGRKHYQAIIRDISERKQDEKLLKESEEKYRTLFESSSEGIFLMTDVFLDCNEKACRLWACQREDIIGHSPMEFSPPRQPDGRSSEAAARERIRKAISGEPQFFYWQHRRKDGVLIDTEISLIAVTVTGRLLVQATLRDISDRKQAEAEIKLNEARLASLVKIAHYESESIQDLLDFALNEAIALTGSKIGYICFYDDETRQFTLNTWSKEVMQECTIAEPPTIFQLEKTGIWGEAVRQARPIMVNDFPAPHPLKRGYPEGHAALYKYLTIPVFSGERIVAVAAVANKATDYDQADVRQLTLMMDAVWKILARRQAEEALRFLNLELELRVEERTAQLEAANRELETFSYSVSHDLRAPLRGIDGWSLAFLEDYGDGLDEQGRNYLGWVRAETQRMGQLIDDLLSLSRVSRAEMRREPVDLTALVQAIADKLRQTDPERQAEFIIQPGLAATGDPRLLEMALVNLLENAWKFTGKQPVARIEFGGMEQDGRPVFFLRDNGTGFDMAYASNLFGAFQRLHQASEFPGTGIGLATVQRIINRHGGRIWAEAAVDQGATFYFTL